MFSFAFSHARILRFLISLWSRGLVFVLIKNFVFCRLVCIWFVFSSPTPTKIFLTFDCCISMLHVFVSRAITWEGGHSKKQCWEGGISLSTVSVHQHIMAESWSSKRPGLAWPGLALENCLSPTPINENSSLMKPGNRGFRRVLVYLSEKNWHQCVNSKSNLMGGIVLEEKVI